MADGEDASYFFGEAPERARWLSLVPRPLTGSMVKTWVTSC